MEYDGGWHCLPLAEEADRPQPDGWRNGMSIAVSFLDFLSLKIDWRPQSWAVMAPGHGHARMGTLL